MATLNEVRDAVEALAAAREPEAVAAALDRAERVCALAVAERDAALSSLRGAYAVLRGVFRCTDGIKASALVDSAAERALRAREWYDVAPLVSLPEEVERTAFAICAATVGDDRDSCLSACSVEPYRFDEDDDPASWEQWDSAGEPHSGMWRDAARSAVGTLRELVRARSEEDVYYQLQQEESSDVPF